MTAVITGPLATPTMDEFGRLTPAVNRFPSAGGGHGFKPLADFVHSLGLKFGVHLMRGVPRQAVRASLPVSAACSGGRVIIRCSQDDVSQLLAN